MARDAISFFGVLGAVSFFGVLGATAKRADARRVTDVADTFVSSDTSLLALFERFASVDGRAAKFSAFK